MRLKIHMSLSIGFVGAKHEDTIEIDDAPDNLSEDDLNEWLRDNYWTEWAWGYIDGGVSIVERVPEQKEGKEP